MSLEYKDLKEHIKKLGFDVDIKITNIENISRN